MKSEESHLSDQDLVLLVDGELSAGEKVRAATHLNQCWACRTRKQEIEQTIGDFVRLHRSGLDPLLPPVSGPRAQLKARLAQAASDSDRKPQPWAIPFTGMQAGAALALLLVLMAVFVVSGRFQRGPGTGVSLVVRNVPVSFPEPSLTPGAVTAATREQICSMPEPKNRAVPLALRRRDGPERLGP